MAFEEHLMKDVERLIEAIKSGDWLRASAYGMKVHLDALSRYYTLGNKKNDV